eukprot:jgi/Psemu1/8083/gm1.8083_g
MANRYVTALNRQTRCCLDETPIFPPSPQKLPLTNAAHLHKYRDTCTATWCNILSAERNKAYATVFGYFTLTSTPQSLLEQLLNLFEAEAVGALGIFYPGPLAQHSPNKNKAFGYLDDIEGEAGELVLVDSVMLSPTTALRVLTLNHHLTELDAHPGRLSILVIPEGTGHSELIRAHKAFFIPFDQAMGVLHPQLYRVGLMESWSPAPPTSTLSSWLGLHLQTPGEIPSSYSQKAALGSPGDPALTAAVTALTDHQLKLSENLDHKRSQSAWAQKSKHERTHMIFQSQVAARASELGIQAPLITTAALKRFQDGNFHGTDLFDVADGILPMAFTPPGGSATTLKQEQEAATNLESYLAVLATILGLNHDVIQQMPLQRAIADEIGDLLTPAIVVYYFQIQVRGWLEEQWEADATSNN